MKGRGAEPDYHIAKVGEDVNARVRVTQTVSDAPDAQPDEDEVGGCVDRLGAIVRDVVVLPGTVVSDGRGNDGTGCANLLTPVQGRCLVAPEAMTGFAIRDLELHCDVCWGIRSRRWVSSERDTAKVSAAHTSGSEST